MIYFGITVNDFSGEIQLDLKSNLQAGFELMANQVIEDCLKDLFGDKLYIDFMSDLSTSKVPQTQEFIDLVNGKSYIRSYSNETISYAGLKRMLKYFVFSYYLENKWSINTMSGQVNTQHENSQVINRSDLRKVRMQIQHKAVDLYNKAVVFIDDNWTTYFDGNDYTYWYPVRKYYEGSIRTITPDNKYFKFKSSEEN